MAQALDLWSAIGNQVQKSLRNQMGMQVISLGQFGYSPTEGAVFIPSSSLPFKAGKVDSGQLKPFLGRVSTHSSLSLARLSTDLKVSLDQARLLLESATNSLKTKQEHRQEIPKVGTLIIQAPLIAVQFVAIPSTSGVTMTQEAASWLQTNLGIDLKSDTSRPRTSSSRNSQKIIPLTTRNLPSSRPASVSSEQIVHSRSLGQFHKETTAELINLNLPRILLTCQAQDQSSRGLLPFNEFVAILMGIEPRINEIQLKRLLAVNNCVAGGKVKFKVFLDEISKTQRNLFGSKSSVVSDLTENYSKDNLAPIAQLIWEKKLVITEMSQASGMRPRIEIQPSELLSVLKKSGVFINIHQLKALLKESDSVNILSLIKTCKSLSQPNDETFQSEVQRPYSSLVSDTVLDKLRNYLCDFNLSEIFSLSSRGTMLHVDDFVNFISEHSFGKIKPIEAQQSFFRVSRNNELLSESDFCKGFAKYESPKQIQDRGFKFLRSWLREGKLSTEQGFEQLLKQTRSLTVLNFEAWVSAMQSLGFNLYEASILFDVLDTKQDKVIDLPEWLNKVYEEQGLLQSFKDTVLKYKIDKEDLLIKLNAQSKQRLSIEDMAEALRRMDPTITLSNAVNMAKVAAGNKGYIDVQDFLAQLSQEPEEFQGSWKEQILRKIQNKVKGNVEDLRKILEDADFKNTGKLELVKFQECIFKAGLGLESVEIDRLGRVLDRKNNLTVDYNEFLDHLEGPFLPPQDPLKSTAARLQVFLKQNELSANQLLKKLGIRVSVQKFSGFLKKKVQKKFSETLLDEVAEKFDVNKDGFIDIFDLSAILGSKSYLELGKGNTFPTRPLSPDRAKVVIKDIRNALVSHKVNFFDAFSALDSENLGVLSAKQFSEGLSKYISLSEQVKNGLFALIDKLGTGLITFDSFLSVIKDSNIDPKPLKDSWSWENETIERIRVWILSQSLSVENAFRAFDSDFDGVISKDDLKSGLKTVLKLQEKDCRSSKVDRLYKLMDTFKRNSIQLSDFKLLFEENVNPNWKNSARQQLGLFISKNYSSLKSAFEAVSELTGKVKLDQFIKWVEQKQVLGGFNLTQQLLEKLFADLDPHRKAYITENDWNHAFTGFSYHDQCIKELKDAVRSNFSESRSAFEYFCSFHNTQPSVLITLTDFQQGIASLVPKRFSPAEVESFWSHLWKSETVDFATFHKEFQDMKFLSTFSQSSKKSSSLSTPVSFSSFTTTKSQDPLKRLQSLIKASPINLEEVFKKIDTDDSGKLSVIEFRKALRKLAVGLSARDIDLVMSRIDTNNDGQIDWQEFQKSFKQSETERYTTGVAQNRLLRMKQAMHSYMLSPKDAFSQFDPDRSGFLDFSKFNNLVNRLCELSGEPVPAFTVLKDLYDIIDIRKDGLIDLREWLNSFRGEQVQLEDSKDFDELTKTISRNRKLLSITFEAMSRTGRIELSKAKEVLISVTRHLKVSEEVWNRVLSVAVRDGALDYKFFLDIYKDRALMKQWHPRPGK
jgi:Ca2+-binding EF-hand superfamily protein